MLRSQAFIKVNRMFYKNIKNVFNLPKKGITAPIEIMFEAINPENSIIRGYVKNFYKWYEHEKEKIIDRT